MELDGRHHGAWAQIKKDQRRNNGSVVRGYSVLRYCYDDVVHHPAWRAKPASAAGRGVSS